MIEAAPIPVAIVTGFLGAGKTSLLNTLLRAREMAATLALINEWGEIGIDHFLIEKIDGDMILLNSGCVCCTLRGDLVESLRDRLARRDSGAMAPFERIVIETTGLADPSPILQAILGDPLMSRRLRLAGIVAVVDAVNGAQTIARHRVNARQIALADVLAIAKSDLIDPARAATLADLRERLRTLNPVAPIVDIAAGALGPTEFFALERRPFASNGAGVAAQAQTLHNAWIRTRILRLEKPTETAMLAAFLQALGDLAGPGLLRLKGLVALADDPVSPLVLHGAQHVIHPPRRLAQWPDGDRSTRIVMIVEGVAMTAIDRLFGALSGDVSIDAPDMAALTQSPLSARRGGLLG
jgi:G3E family GTPase